MSADVDRLVAHGFEPEAARSRALLLAQAEAGFIEMTGRPPAWRWIVPGRLEVFGKHTDYAGGRSLIAAVPRGFAVVAREREDDLVRVLDARNAESTLIDRTGTARPRRGWATYVSTVVLRLSANFPGAPLGLDLAFASDLPRAAGVSSSSALLVGVATALVRRGRLADLADWQLAVRSPLDHAGYFGCIENGRSFRSLVGARGVGTQGGSEDHTAILLSAPGMLRQFSYTPVTFEDEVALPSGWRFVIASSGVHADKAGSVRDRYNRAAEAAAVLLDLWRERSGRPSVSLGTTFGADPGAAAQLRRWVEELGEEGRSGIGREALARRLAHLLAEDARVPAAVAAIRRADVGELGRLAGESQADAAALLGNQVPETAALVAEALRAGAGAACSFGAGFGGSAWALVPAAEADRFGARWGGAYRIQFPQLTRIEWFIAAPAPPLVAV